MCQGWFDRGGADTTLGALDSSLANLIEAEVHVRFGARESVAPAGSTRLTSEGFLVSIGGGSGLGSMVLVHELAHVLTLDEVGAVNDTAGPRNL